MHGRREWGRWIAAAGVERHERILVRYVRRAREGFGLTYYLVPAITQLPDCRVRQGVGLFGVGTMGAGGGGGVDAAEIEARGSWGSLGGGTGANPGLTRSTGSCPTASPS